MTRWTKFNIVIFLTILFLAILVRQVGQRPASVQSTVTPLPTTTLENNPESATDSANLPEVLGMTTSSEVAERGELQAYESSQLGFMTMVPQGYLLERDILTVKTAAESADVGATTQPTRPFCTFSEIAPVSGRVILEKNLQEYDLPLVEYTKLADTNNATATQVIFTLKNEENQPKLQLNCVRGWQENEAFHSILRAVRYI